jgi:DNA helicase HerA-like ATPase
MGQVPLTSMGAPTSAETELAGRLADYRRVREGIERNVLALATSVDGFTFELQASLYNLDLRRAAYVVLASENGTRLGQITDLRVGSLDASEGAVVAGSTVRVRLAQGTGVVLEDEGRPFHDATVRLATSEEVGQWCRRGRTRSAGLTVGELLLAPGVAATLESGGLNRHTFMCGQSGSGKTYSLGLLLERVLAETSLRVVILDPNSDYVGLPHVREGADSQLAARYAGVPAEVAVWGDDPQATHLLRLRFADLDSATQAALLDLDPIRDREEYALVTELLRHQEDGKPLIARPDQLLKAETPAARQLGLRAMNLGVLNWRIWAPDMPSLVDELRHPTSRCTVVDLGSLATPQEQRLVAEAVLTTLWESRLSRTPCLLVIDEAHNICPADPPDRVTRLSTDRAVQIAAEGRKYGLYLLTSTQRPHKVHDNVVSQCDNLLLMRMNSRADLADLSRLFSFVPDGLIGGATSFRQGQALVAGKLMPRAAYIVMGERVSEEGGADIPTTWATPREPT